MSAVSERDVERHFVGLGDAHGGWVVKLASPGNAGMPDRMVLFPNGDVSFVEIKAPGKKPRPLQERIFDRLGCFGHDVAVIDSLEAAEIFWGAMESHDLMASSAQGG